MASVAYHPGRTVSTAQCLHLCTLAWRIVAKAAKLVSEGYGVSVDSLLRGVRVRGEPRQVALYLCRQHTDARRRQIGECSG